MTYVPASLTIWQGRADSLPGERFFQRVKALDVNSAHACHEPTVALLGFASDEGIRRNLGRTGAALGPDAIRTQLGKLAVHACDSFTFFDAGTIFVTEGQLAEAQAELGEAIKKLRTLNYRTVVLGGGHEVAFGHYLGLEDVNPSIINFDAHFDVRPPTNATPESSGTPFRQIADRQKRLGRQLDYTVIGLQASANTQSLFAAAKDLGVTVITADDIHLDLAAATHTVKDLAHKKSAIYLSICLDVFAQSFAPGTSAPQAFGLSPWQVWQLISPIVASQKIVSIDVAELSPPLDHDHRTARLAAELIARIFFNMR